MSGQAFNGLDQSLYDKFGIVGRILRDELLNWLDILNCSTGPD